MVLSRALNLAVAVGSLENVWRWGRNCCDAGHKSRVAAKRVVVRIFIVAKQTCLLLINKTWRVMKMLSSFIRSLGKFQILIYCQQLPSLHWLGQANDCRHSLAILETFSTTSQEDPCIILPQARCPCADCCHIRCPGSAQGSDRRHSLLIHSY